MLTPDTERRVPKMYYRLALYNFAFRCNITVESALSVSVSPLRETPLSI
jgi:hypothetical protein